jgi:SSS family solute:Na+ symporter
MNGSFEVLDWIVLAIYAVGMMAIGWWYSRADSVEEYMLGNRKMKPWMVGISLYATFMSTLTYLAYPGEMIRHGPMLLASILSYPLIFYVVGRFMIPYIMRLKVTSAYEILELRLGLSVRLLGSSIFLTLRLLWMSLIIFATSDAILVPLLGFNKTATPWICVVMAVITFAYAAMGGLRAVVVTDVVQTFIMLAGAILSLIIITSDLGGVSGWWPHSWSSQWDRPSFFFAPESRISMGMAILSTFTWYICTAGSDQIAIQRYLATRDASAARRMFGFSLLCDTSITLLLFTLGLALFAFFNRHPELLPTGQTVATSADTLLPHFMVRVLPAGISGLVVAGILSSAMDSLSSGLNSTASVVIEDWIYRFRQTELSEKAQVRQAKVVSCLLGVVVISISLIAGRAPGNLLEKCFKVVNLMTAPLFILFFMAMFVPWATWLGTWVAAIVSTFVAIRIAYYNTFGLSFVWIIPASLIVGILVGCLASCIPAGKRRPMLRASEQSNP